jgi:hypothetical protein
MSEDLIPVYLSENEASVFIAMREARVFEMKDIDIVLHFNSDSVLTDIKKPIVAKRSIWTFIYKRKKII